MQLGLMSWPEVEEHLSCGSCVMLPTGSTEQYGPIWLIGTDTICASEVALAAAKFCGGIVAPPIAYTPAPFNTAFPGTVSVTPEFFSALLQQVCEGFLAPGFQGVFIVNGHGANLEPAHRVADGFTPGAVCVRSWWDPAPVAALRDEMFGGWEGMHATPSGVAMTQTLYGSKTHEDAESPPEKLSPAYIKARGGDKHGPPDAHRAQFPDGRVGSHSALATPEKGAQLLDVTARAIAAELEGISAERKTAAS